MPYTRQAHNALLVPAMTLQILARHCGLVVYMAFSHEVRALTAIIAIILLVGLDECVRELTKCVVCKKKKL